MCPRQKGILIHKVWEFMDLTTFALNFNHLRLFLAVAEYGGVTRAAEAVFVSQPAVSKAVQELERQVGVPLLEHIGRRVVLTEAGEILADYARRIFTLATAGRQAMDELRGLDQGHLSIGASTTIGIYLLPAVMGVYHARYPAITLALDIENTELVIARLRSSAIDLALVEGPVAGDDLHAEPYRDDTLTLVTAPGHALAERGTATPADLVSAPFLMREFGSGTREVVETALRQHGITPVIAMELGHTEAIKLAVAAGLGVSILSTLTVQHELARDLLVAVPIAGVTIRRTLLRMQRRDYRPSSAARAFLDLLAPTDTDCDDG